MPQISLYIDEKTLKKVEAAAMHERVSISKWVAEQIRSRIEPAYPRDFIDLFGSVKDATLTRPPESSFDDDTKRERL